jgi:glyoxylate/hydroxypyruvate reductase
MERPAPSIFFNSDIDSPDEGRAALATQFQEFTFSTNADLEDPTSVDIALVWKLPDDGLGRFVNLRAILSLGAGINQLNPKDLPVQVPLARLVDASLTRTMVEYAKTAVYRYHRRFHVFERRSSSRCHPRIPFGITPTFW